MTPILGIFDSGVGGFTVLKKVIENYPEVSCLYLGDTARLPYGEKKTSEIRLIAEQVVNWLNDQNVTCVLVACNTTNSLALDIVEGVSNVPVFSLIDSAVGMINKDRIGVLSTPATAASFEYTKKIKILKPNSFVLEKGCPELVPLIESGQLLGDEVFQIAKKYLSSFCSADIEEIVFGCSHYPLLKPVFQRILTSQVDFIDPAIGLVQKLETLLGPPKSSFDRPISLANTRICVTADPGGFAKRAKHWLGKCPQVELVSLRSKAYFF